MSKYDFGYKLEKGSTNEWAYKIIKEKSIVLELGPAIGNLTFHLFQKKQCVVDIIEIDEEAGEKASEFADISLIGEQEGNLNEENWYEKLKQKKYDYIIALDVLEHLVNPEKVLALLKTLLKGDGEIILSVPNITHNAVINAMLNNKFDYTDLGLLDRTHIHFFSYESIKEMIKNVRLGIKSIDFIRKSICDTEIEGTYKKLPIEVESFLRTREYGDVYQYLMVLNKKENQQLLNSKLEISLDNKYQTKVLINGLMENVLTKINSLQHITWEIDLSKYKNLESIRLIPLEKPCLVIGLEIKTIGDDEKIIYSNWTTGIEINKQTFVLFNNGYEINYLIEPKTKKISVSYQCIVLNEDIVNAFKYYKINYNNIQDNNNVLYLNLEKNKNKLEQTKGELEQTKGELEQTKGELEQTKGELEQTKGELEQTKGELKQIKDTIIYKMCFKMYSILKR